jgi:AcrR family transcriptional regulator
MTAMRGRATAPPKRRRSREITEEAIYSAAARLFATQGYASTTLEQIAREVGVHKSTIFHYVTIKDELLAIILDRGLRDYVESLEEIAGRPEDGGIRFRAAVRNHLRFVFQHGTELQIFLRERQHLNSKKGRAYLRMKERYEELFTGIADDGMRDGTIAPGDPSLLCLFVLGSANSVVEWFSDGGRLSAAEITDQFLETMVPTLERTLEGRARKPDRWTTPAPEGHA